MQKKFVFQLFFLALRDFVSAVAPFVEYIEGFGIYHFGPMMSAPQEAEEKALWGSCKGSALMYAHVEALSLSMIILVCPC